VNSMPAPSAHHQSDPVHQAAHDYVVVGVDTHKDVHVAAVLTGAGVGLGSLSFPATRAGYRDLLAWAQQFGSTVVAGVEGTGSWGAGLVRFLRAEGVRVIEVNRPDRSLRRRRGKTDTIDAEAAARAVISGQASVTPKTADGSVEAPRFYKLAKDSAVKSRTQAINQLKGVWSTATPTCGNNSRV